MPVTIIEKRKTEPTCPLQHTALVPLRIMSIERVPNNLESSIGKELDIGDVVMTMPSAWHRVEAIFNCTKGCVIDRRFNESIRCVRAYDIAQVVLANDNEPAPIV